MVFAEPGVDVILRHGTDAAISTVNASEALAKLSDRGAEMEWAERRIAQLAPTVFVFDEEIARLAGRMRAATRYHDISFGDRACLATGLRWSLPVFTADRAWSQVDVGVQVHQIR
jgi:PIN domain nuclease of toxin-antitoxin system